MRRLPLLLAVAVLTGSAPAVSTASGRAASGCPRETVESTGQQAIAALTRLVPQTYADMTNQQGRGAWRDYVVTALFSIGPDRDPTMPTRFRRAAVRACGGSVADHTWVALISFPEAQGIDFGGSAAYLAATRHGWVIWRHTVRRGT